MRLSRFVEHDADSGALAMDPDETSLDVETSRIELVHARAGAWARLADATSIAAVKAEQIRSTLTHP